MADVRITDLSQSAPLTGSEVLPIVQNDVTVKTTVQDIANLGGGGGGAVQAVYAGTGLTLSGTTATPILSIGYTAENVANKKTTTSLSENSDVFYPSQKAVKTYVDASVVGLLNDRGSYTPSGSIGGSYPSTGGSGTGGAIKKGDIWFIDGVGYLGTTPVVVGTSVRALIDDADPDSDADWNILNVGLGYVPENVLNKSTNVLLGTSDTLYPSQKAVKTYVDTGLASLSGWSLSGNSGTTAGINFIGTMDGQDVVFKRNGIESFRINSSNDIEAISGIKTVNNISGTIAMIGQDSFTKGYLFLGNGTGAASVQCTNLTSYRTLELPNKDGTLATTDDVGLPYLVYTALISANSGSPTVKILKNTLGTTINWTNPLNGVIRGFAASGTPFVTDKCWISSGSYDMAGAVYFVTGSIVPAIQRVDLKFFYHDGTLTGTPNFVDYSIEIRVYP